MRETLLCASVTLSARILAITAIRRACQHLLFTAGSGLVQFFSLFPPPCPSRYPKLRLQVAAADAQVDTLDGHCVCGRRDAAAEAAAATLALQAARLEAELHQR